MLKVTGYTTQVIDKNTGNLSLEAMDRDATLWRTVGTFAAADRDEAHRRALTFRDGDGWPVVRVVAHEVDGDRRKNTTEVIMQRLAKREQKRRRKSKAV